jgi:hypothetical protein
MNYEYRIKAAEMGIEQLLKDLTKLREDFEEAKTYTGEFLAWCSKNGVNRVGIGMRDDGFKDSANYPFGASGSIFADGCELDEKGRPSWPIAWKLADGFGISGGAGNSGERQISLEARNKLIDGIYECKNGQWRKVDEKRFH